MQFLTKSLQGFSTHTQAYSKNYIKKIPKTILTNNNKEGKILLVYIKIYSVAILITKV